jgi:Aldehyde dehydrogenase family
MEAGLADGVVNVITTSTSSKVSAPIIADPRLRKLTFTGSTSVGQKLIQQSAQQVLRISMELGGNAPFLIFADANLDAAVEGAMLAKMRNIGEACTAANRFIVHESMAEEFAARFAAKMSELTVGPGIEDGVKVGPLIDQTAIDKVTELVGDAVDHGADVLTGGERIDRPVTSTGPPSCPRCPSRRGSSGRRSSARWRRSPPSGTTTKVWTGERHRVRIGRVRVHSEPDPGNPRRRRTADGHGGHQPGPRVQPSSPVRRRQGLRAGA